ncbi:uncharacterized protein [Antedon mediterranea]|uniref:uncharacterized protein n=1 Tax=Antedon mediterranea TaxID=105859 RepID=UPI003AF7F747
MAIMKYCCFCFNLRSGTMVAAMLSLILSMLAALGYVWTLLEFVVFEPSLSNNNYVAGWIVNLCLVVLQVLVIIYAFILFIGAFCWSDGAGLFYVVTTALTYLAELGCVIYIAYLHSEELENLAESEFVIAQIAFFIFRTLVHVYVMVLAFAFYEFINERRNKYVQNR